MHTPFGPSIDWWRVVVDLERKGYTLTAMAAAVSVPKSTLKGWKNVGAEPGHSAGERLVALWCRVQGEGPECAPRTVRTISAARMDPKAPSRQLLVRPELEEALRGWA